MRRKKALNRSASNAERKTPFRLSLCNSLHPRSNSRNRSSVNKRARKKRSHGRKVKKKTHKTAVQRSAARRNNITMMNLRIQKTQLSVAARLKRKEESRLKKHFPVRRKSPSLSKRAPSKPISASPKMTSSPVPRGRQ
jgi:hypothetical protein